MKEKPTGNAIIAVIKSAIEIKLHALYQLIYLYDIRLEEVYKKLATTLNAKKKVENHSEHVAASFTYDDHFGQDEDRNAAIQWTAGVECHGLRQQPKR